MREGPRRHRQTWGELMPNTGERVHNFAPVHNRSQIHHCGMTVTIYVQIKKKVGILFLLEN